MTPPDSADANVSAERVGYRFVGSDRAALADISLTLAPGSLTLLAGETGSGKSTLMRALAGLIPGSSAGRMEGRVRLFDLDTARASSLELATRAGLVLQSPDDQICTTDPVSEVAFGLENLCLPEAEIEERVNHWLARFELEAVRDQANNTLSGGQKQRLMLASILAMGPRLLLLDEPLAQLDAAGVAELLDELDRLRATGLIVVVAEHRLDELLRRADRLLILAGGRIISDSSSKGAEATAALVQADLAPPTPQPVFIARSTAPSSAEFIVRINGLTFRWPGKAEALWSDVRFDIHPGECVALVGPNGSGKTTLLSALAGLLRPAAGQVEWSEAPRGSSSIGLTPQNPDLALFCRTVGEELAFGPQQLNLPASEIEQRVSQAAEALSIDDLLDQAPLALSQGQRLRVAVAAALTLHPRLLLLDEPSTGQDPRHVGRLLTAVRGYVASGDVGAVLFSTHDPRLVERYATRVLAVAEGKLLADCAPVVLFANEGLLSRAGLRATSRRLQSTTAPVARLARPPR